MEKKKLRIIYQLEKKRIGLDRKKLENYIVGFKFDTPEERAEFKEFVKECYYKGDCCAENESLKLEIKALNNTIINLREQLSKIKDDKISKEPIKKTPKKKPGRPKKTVSKDV